MKHFYFVRSIVLFVLFSPLALFASLDQKSAVVYYGDDISYPTVGIHDYIILEPKYINTNTTGFKLYQDKIYAYVSINEIQESREFAKQIDRSWILGENKVFGSLVMNINNDAYQNFLLNNVIGKLHKKGVKNFFFDTMDSYHIVTKSEEQRLIFQKSLVTFIKKFKQKFPDAKLVVNRGFELIDAIHPYIDALLFESYYYGLDSSSGSYINVSQDDRDWLDIHLNKLKHYGVDIIALDYIDTKDKSKRDQATLMLSKQGFIPYIAEKTLMQIGQSSKNALPREVLMIYNGADIEDNMINSTNSHLFASTPIEYLGYVPVLKDVNSPLPLGDLKNRYAGIIIWLEKPIKNYNKLIKWVLKAIQEDVKILFLGDASLNIKDPMIKQLGINISKNDADKSAKNTIIKQAKFFGYEIKPIAGYDKFLIDIEYGESLFSYKTKNNKYSSLGAKMPWGGFVRDQILASSFGEYTMWVADPFRLFIVMLDLKPMPIPDPTTENGKRLGFVHIDGDGSMNRVENNPKLYSIDLILSDFIEKYHFPQSVSIVESEIAPYGKFPKDSPALIKAARAIYSYPHVEAATHTFAHPFNWRKLEKDPTNQKYMIPLKNYTFTIDREIGGSLSYINKYLLPKGKKRAKTIFWSGDCMPSENVLEYTYKNGITNINGGDTTITNDRPWLSLIQPYGLKTGKHYQVYTGQQNENVYTKDWRGPFWGFKKVIQTFDLTNKPRRLKPVDVYYHFYSASKRAAYVALKNVYDWVDGQDLMHIFTSDYPAKVTNFYDASLANEGNRWLLCGFDALRTVRLPKILGYPDLENSYGVVGYKDANMDNYVHLDSKKTKLLTLATDKQKQNMLIDSNARLIDVLDNRMHFRGHTAIELTFSTNTNNCLSSNPKADQVYTNQGKTTLKFKNAGDVYVTTQCTNR